MAQQSCSYCGGLFNGVNYPSCSIVRAENEFVHDLNPFPYDNTSDFYDQPPQHHVETYSCELCGNNSHYGYDCPPRFPPVYEQEPSYNQNFVSHRSITSSRNKYLRFGASEATIFRGNANKINELKDNFNKMSIEIEKITKEKELQQREQAANLSTYTVEPSRCSNFICYDDDDEEITIPLSEIISLSIKSDEVIKSSVEDLAPIPSESEDTSGSDSERDLPACDDFSPIDVPEGIYVTFSNPLFDSNNDFTSSDDELLSDEDVPKNNVKIYLNPLFEFNDEFIPSDINPHFDEVLEDIKSKASYDSNLDEPALLLIPLFDSNKDECFDRGGDVDEINGFDMPSDFEVGYYDLEGDVLYLESFLSDDTTPNLPLEVFLYRDPRSLKDEPDNDDLKSMVKVFDLEFYEKIISLTYMRLPFEDHHYFSLTFVIRIFLPYHTYLMDSYLLLSSGVKILYLTLASSFLVSILKSWWYLIGVELSYALMFI
nr:hypothetical protein [Tanacetum cinerariifolium]